MGFYINSDDDLFKLPLHDQSEENKNYHQPETLFAKSNEN